MADGRANRRTCVGTVVNGKRAGQSCRAAASVDVSGAWYCRSHAPASTGTGQSTCSSPEGTSRRVSGKLRFEIFKRDKFTCQYCGRKAPDVLLEVDHIHPVAKGGADEVLNLLTACGECNRGKGARTLADGSALALQRRQLEDLQERREQLELLMQWKNELLSVQERALDEVAAYWSKLCPGWVLNTDGLATLKTTLQKYGASETMEAIDAAASQYLKLDNGEPTAASVNKAWGYVPRIASMRRVHEKNPHLKDLFYVRGIMRNRYRYCNEHEALEILKNAYAAGADIDELKEIARCCRNWSEWTVEMHSLLVKLRKEA